jgi:DNA-binding protein H-NS
MNILEKANEITNKRSEEKERMYGPFEERMTKAAEIATLMTSKIITTEDMYKCMVALKLSRESYSHKEDNLLDAVAYLGSLNNFINNKNN